ncbi:MAG: hypothetical protein SFU25_00485 [Candidatus Caenarcaniphilales bacterium]|nr:hypothetical protein [Candidatus Caenarcaniphilales bacterium]
MDNKVNEPKKPHNTGPDKHPKGGNKGPVGNRGFSKGAVPRPRMNKPTNRGR